MEEVAVAAAATRREGNIDRSSRVDESPAKGDKGAIALEGMVDRRFFPSWTSKLPIFFAEIILVTFSSKLTLFLFLSVRPLPVVTQTPPVVPLPTMPSTLPWPRRPPWAAMLLEILCYHIVVLCNIDRSRIWSGGVICVGVT
jgi:hypothetical protein